MNVTSSPWDKESCCFSAYKGHLDVLQRAYTNECSQILPYLSWLLKSATTGSRTVAETPPWH